MGLMSYYWNGIYSYCIDNPWVTIVQVVTAIPYGIAFWRETKKPLLQWVAASCVLFAVGYLMLSAYSGIVIAIGTLFTTIIGIQLGKRKSVSLKSKLLIFGIMVVLTIAVSLSIEQTPMMWLILIAGFFDYFAYIVCKNYDKSMHIILIFSQVTLVVYEICFSLYLFALLDFVTTVLIGLHLWKKIRHINNNAVKTTCGDSSL